MEGEEEDMPLVFGSNICGTQQKYLGFSEQDLNQNSNSSGLTNPVIDVVKYSKAVRDPLHDPLPVGFLLSWLTQTLKRFSAIV